MTNKKIALAALCLMVLAAALTLLQATTNPDHSSGPSAEQVPATQTAESSQPDLESARLASMEKEVEEARGEAISAGITLGDGAGPYIDNYRAQLRALEQAKARLNTSHTILTKAR
jgi:hypothetical protein